ncbi:MAG: NADH-quinone oxidoreductase subunit N [Candidatus Dormibacteraeota bacterium]|nr:NADH-quinone oxidoreductase subunit N [Candidatus Dormibacteraeota bacterium]
MPPMDMGVDLQWLGPELILAGLVLLLLPLGVLLPAAWRWLATAVALLGLGSAGTVSVIMLGWAPRVIFLGTYAVDPFAVYFKLIAIGATGVVLLATLSYFADRPYAGVVPAVLVLTCLGLLGLAASQDLALIALFIQLVTVGSYILVGVAKTDRRATEGALKLFLYSATAGAVMLYGMSLLFGLTGTLRLPELATRLPAASLLAVGAGLGLLIVGYGYKITAVPFHTWAPDTYQGAPTAIAGFLSVGPKAAGLAVLLRTLVVAFPGSLGHWPEGVAGVAALTMTVGNLFALRQRSAKRMLAYSSIGQAGYLLVGVAAAGRDRLAIPGLLLYLAVYLFMNLGAFLAVDALERRVDTDSLDQWAGLGRRLPIAAAALTLCVLSLAGFPPFGGFVGKTMLFGAALGAGWTWLALVMAAIVALSLVYYVRLIEPLYLRAPQGTVLAAEPTLLRVALLVLAAGTLLSGVFPGPWVALAIRASALLGGGGGQ